MIRYDFRIRENFALSRRVVIALAIVVGLSAVGVSLMWLSGPRDFLSLAKAAEQRSDWSHVIGLSESRLKHAPNDPQAVLLLARGLAHLDHSSDALAAYWGVDANLLTADDLRRLSAIFEGERRNVLAWLALDAAGRINPRDASVRDAMAKLHQAVGSKGEVAHTTDLLSSVANGPALAQLVLELARLAKTDANDDPILDRVLLRDRTSLRKLDSPAAVERFIARILLEEGRPLEARERLETILREGGDPESSWLMSRVGLQLGDDLLADTSIAAAKDFAQAHRTDHEPSTFVGAKSCRACHSEIYDAQQSSRHAKTIHHGPDMLRIKVPDAPVIDPANPNVKHVFTRDGETVKLATTVGDTTYRAILDYAIGSGHRGVTMVGKDEHGDYRELRISEYSETGTQWDVTSGFSPHPSNPSEYLGKGLAPSGFRDCLHCHTTRFRSPDAPASPEKFDNGIGCERCHGPAGNHVKAVASGFAEVAIGRPKGATGPQRMKICAECHASDGTFPPTDPQYIRFQSSTLPNSKCFTESQGKLDCMTCHDPHKPMETSPKYYESKCLECHGASADEKPLGFRRVTCPVNASQDCLKCHMPTVPEVVPHTSFTDHQIRVHRGENPR